MDNIFLKYGWKKISSASNSSDDVWIKYDLAIIHGYFCSDFYVEELVNGSLLSINDPNRKTSSFRVSYLKEFLEGVEYSKGLIISENRNKKIESILG